MRKQAKSADTAVLANGNPNPPAPEPVALAPEPLDSRQVSYVAPDYYRITDRVTGVKLFEGSFEGVQRYMGWAQHPEADHQPVTVTFTRRELTTLIGHMELYLENFKHDPIMEPLKFVHRKLTDVEERAVRGEPQREVHQHPTPAHALDPYEAELRQRAAARYPNPDQETAAKIEAKIQRLLLEHRQLQACSPEPETPAMTLSR